MADARSAVSIRKLLPWLVAALLVSVAGMAWAVARTRPALASIAAGTFTYGMILLGFWLNRSLWRLPDAAVTPQAAPVAGLRNAVMISLLYAWGAAALASVYGLSGLKWQHGWQYAAGMALIAAAVGLYARQLASPDSGLRQPSAQLAMLRLTVLHAAAAAVGLGFLFLSGKLKSPKADWAANIVFLMGGVAILALSVIAAYTQSRLTRRA